MTQTRTSYDFGGADSMVNYGSTCVLEAPTSSSANDVVLKVSGSDWAAFVNFLQDGTNKNAAKPNR